MAASPRIVLLHATPVAMEPIRNAFARRWPTAETVNLLDDSLSVDRAREPELTDNLIERFVAFGRYAHRSGADGILITCSAFGPAIDRLIDELPIPVLKPNEAMFRAAISQGRRIGMLATFAPAVVTMREEFDEFVRQAASDASLTTIVVDRAIDLLRQGDAATHNELVAARAPELKTSDAIMLAHFSTSRAAEAVRAVVDVPVLTAPDAAVDLMQQLLAA
ncbi:aspartate/glutamate racemase family protein [Ancylobacter sp. A5.8]|uniref:aspartate/glutamate racemase family protein n=1 Tax=Ancylobacter gelatini TaxID=2919920 RepID=UPI001F4E47E7|nr:aspartate/glutamate racemase family protein [Ancylobacter gelatini]MCJ8141399.1 aspartate/glutamate racemase family protein [Ancylobacter gelatini]